MLHHYSILGKREDLVSCKEAIDKVIAEHKPYSLYNLVNEHPEHTGTLIRYSKGWAEYRMGAVKHRSSNEPPTVRLYLGASGGGKSTDCMAWLRHAAGMLHANCVP